MSMGARMMRTYAGRGGFWAISVAAGIMLASTAQAATYASAQSGYWTNPATWGGTGIPGAGDDVAICAGHTITNTGTSRISINSLSIAGTLTHALGVAHAINLNIAGDLAIDATGSINADAKGQESLGTGPNRTSAGHGGVGAWGAGGGTAGGTTYGSITASTGLRLL